MPAPSKNRAKIQLSNVPKGYPAWPGNQNATAKSTAYDSCFRRARRRYSP
jgi:hypothetical protein